MIVSFPDLPRLNFVSAGAAGIEIFPGLDSYNFFAAHDGEVTWYNLTRSGLLEDLELAYVDPTDSRVKLIYRHTP